MSFTADERRQILWLYDHSHGDPDYVVERVNFTLLQRNDVMAVVLYETRRQLRPDHAGSGLALLGAVA